MAFVLKNRVQETWVGTGTGSIALAGAYPDHRRFSAVMAIGDITWATVVNPGANEWETIEVTYSAANTLTRGTTIDGTNGASAVNFSAGTKIVFIDLPAIKIGLLAARGLLQLDASGKYPAADGSALTYSDRTNIIGASFSAGTAMLFIQTAAPTGWTKSTTHNDKALRIVNGPAGSGGSVAFSTVFGRTATDGFTLNGNHLPPTTPTGSVSRPSINVSANLFALLGAQPGASNFYTAGSNPIGITAALASDPIFSGNSFGSAFAFTIGMDIRVQYVDAIICTKD